MCLKVVLNLGPTCFKGAHPASRRRIPEHLRRQHVEVGPREEPGVTGIACVRDRQLGRALRVRVPARHPFDVGER